MLDKFFDAPGIHEALVQGGLGEDAFYANIRLPNGTFKTTCKNRFDDVDAWVCGQLGQPRPLRVLDIGVSSAVTTLDLWKALNAAGFAPQITGVDLYPAAYLLDACGVRILAEGDHIYQVEIGGLRIPNTLSLGNPLTAAVYQAARAACRLFGKHARPIPLVTPALAGSGIKVVRADVMGDNLAEMGTGYQFVRAMNIINDVYFSAPMIAKAMRNLHEVLAPDGMFLVGRTLEQRTNATLFRRLESGFVPVARFGDGSDVEALVPVAAATI